MDTGICDLTSSHFWFYPTQSSSWILSRVFLQKTPVSPTLAPMAVTFFPTVGDLLLSTDLWAAGTQQSALQA